MWIKSNTDTVYQNEKLKSLTRYRFDKVKERAKLKQSVSRLVNNLFPELETLVPTPHMLSAYNVITVDDLDGFSDELQQDMEQIVKSQSEKTKSN